MARVNATLQPAERDSTKTLVTMGAIIASLYFGSEIFVPIALAILLSFVLAPAVRKLHALGIGRVFPVLLVTALAFTVIFGLGFLIAGQLKNLADELPRYETTMTKKIAMLKGATNGGAFERLDHMFTTIDKAINRSTPQPPSAANSSQAPTPNQPATSGAATADKAAHPVAVEVLEPPQSPIQTISTFVSPLLHPLATAGIVVIFVIFILLQREDLRNRLIRLFGASDLQRTTAAIDDGAKRLSRYLLTQSAVNAIAGLIIGVAAWLVGVPNPVLWGIFFGCMRFVPYIGPVIGGAMPILFAAAVDPGWSMALWMASIVVAAELIIGQVIEPLLYGHNTGLSPVAVVMSATFWTALWGPVGLLLATPLTVCLVVIGRHVEQMEFLEILLGDQPPLTAPETFYQRMLAKDATEVSDQAAECLKSMSLTDYYDDVMLPGLLLAQDDVTAERLTVERQLQIRDATEEVIEDLDDDGDVSISLKSRWDSLRHGKAHTAEFDTVETTSVPPAWQQQGRVLCIGSRGPLDDCGAHMLAQVLRKRGVGARAESYTSLSKASIDQLDASKAHLICLSCFDGSSSAYIRFAIRRVRRRAPTARILIGAWWMQTQTVAAPSDVKDDQSFREAFATTIVDAARFCLAAASALPEDELITTETTEREEASPVA